MSLLNWYVPTELLAKRAARLGSVVDFCTHTGDWPSVKRRLLCYLDGTWETWASSEWRLDERGSRTHPCPTQEGNLLHCSALCEIPSWEGQGWVDPGESLTEAIPG